MGNAVTKTLDKWGINSRKFTVKRTARKAPAREVPSNQTTDAHIYDSVAAEPQYAKVNKKRTTMDGDGLHYADIEVFQSASPDRREKQWTTPQNSTTTEYATIDFLRGVKTSASAEPADILIPPGELQRPLIKPQRKKSAASHRSVMV